MKPTIIILLICLLFYSTSRFVESGKKINLLLDTLEPLINYPKATYDEKMNRKFPQFYSLITNVKSRTPEKAIIIIPNEEEMLEYNLRFLGDLDLVSSMLFPRKVIRQSMKEYNRGGFVYTIDARGGVSP